MKRALSLLLMGLIGAAIAGCEASARVDDPDDVEYKKTTTVRESDGDVHSKTEIRRDD
jgi:hypothetical protein